MRDVPENYVGVSDIMSNFDHEINKDIENTLINENVYVGYPAWNFHGTVWHEDDKFYCRIKQYGKHVETIESAKLEEIMDIACERYGID